MDTMRDSAKKSLSRFQEKWYAWVKKYRGGREELGPEEAFANNEEGALSSALSKFVGSFSAKERLIMLFVFGVVLGFGAKIIATDSITMGYRDYTVSKGGTYDLIALQKKVSENGGAANFSGGIQQGGACAAQ